MKDTRSILRLLFAAAGAAACAGVVAALAPPVVRAESPVPARARPAGAHPPETWLSGNRIRLTAAAKDDPKSITYSFTVAGNGDLKIEIEDRSGSIPSSGEMLLVSNRFLGVRGLSLARDYEIDALDAAALSWQLVARLLERGAPGDPKKVSRAARVSVVERQAPLTVSTTSGEETFPPPWEAQGRVNPLGDGRVFFELIFASRTTPRVPATPRSPAPPMGTAEMRYSGTWERTSPPPEIRDSASLAGWTIFALGNYKRKTSQGSIVDYGATPVAERYGTVGDLRRAAVAGK